MKKTKLFISHASEDKADFVEPLALALQSDGFEVWYDRFVLTLGDSLLKKISDGLRGCDFGVVVLSDHFFRKKWPQAELDALFSIETSERKVILPVWKGVTEDNVMAFSPIIAGKLGAIAEHGVDSVVREIKRAVETAATVKGFSEIETVMSQFQSLDRHIDETQKAKHLESSEEGVARVRDAAHSILSAIRSNLSKLSKESKNLRFHFDERTGADELDVRCPSDIQLAMVYSNHCSNSINPVGYYHPGATFRLDLWHHNFMGNDDGDETTVLLNRVFTPKFDHSLNVVWSDPTHSFTTEELTRFVMNELHKAIKAHLSD